MQNTEEILMRVGMDLASINAKTNELLQRQQKAAGSIKSMWNELGAVFSGAAILGGIKKVIDRFDDLQDRADNLGVGTDFLQGMGVVASQNAVGGVETFNKAITELSSKLGDAKDGGDKSIATFAKWGITLKDIKDLNTEKMFYLISDKINAIQDPAIRTAASFDLLGKAGKNMTGVLSGGSSSLKKLSDSIEKLDATKLKELAEAKDKIENLINILYVGFGTLIGWITVDFPKALGKAADIISAIFSFNILKPKKSIEEIKQAFENYHKSTIEEANKREADANQAKIAAIKKINDAKKEELETTKQIAKEAKAEKITKLTTERTEILKTLHSGERFSTIEEIAGKDAMERIRADYSEGGKNYTGKSRLSGVGEALARAREEEKEMRRQGWTERANVARMHGDKMLGILEKYGAAPKSERISDVVDKLVDVNTKLQNLGVTIVGIK